MTTTTCDLCKQKISDKRFYLQIHEVAVNKLETEGFKIHPFGIALDICDTCRDKIMKQWSAEP